MLTVAIGSLPVLPGLAPMNGCQADEDARRRGARAEAFPHLLARRVDDALAFDDHRPTLAAGVATWGLTAGATGRAPGAT